MLKNEVSNKPHNFFLTTLMSLSFIAIASSFYFYYFKKDYNFIVETKCDPQKETCFHRDCTNPDDCSPDQFSDYNTYTIKARDFKFCQNEDCTLVCTTKLIDCQKAECTESDIKDGTCTVPSNPNILN